MVNKNDLVGFIGLGIMGKPMAINLIKSGFKLTVYDKNPEALKEIESKGVKIAESIASLAKNSDVIITMLPNSPDSLEVIVGDNGIINNAKIGTLVIDMSSIDPIVSIEIGKKLQESGIDFLDAPVSGGEPKAIEGTLAIMAGGKQKTFKKALPFFKAMGNSYILVGNVGAGNFTKLANQIIVALNIAAVCEATLLAKRAGLNITKMYEAIKEGLAGSAVLDSKFPLIANKNFKPGFKIKLHLKDIQNALNTSTKLNVPLIFTPQILEILKSLTLHGYGELDHCAIFKFYENISGIDA